MTLGFTLAILSSVGWGLLDGLRKRMLDDFQPLPAAAWFSLVQLPFLAAWLYLYVPLSGGEVFSYLDMPPMFWLTSGCVVALNSSTFLLYFHAVRISPLALTIPYLSFSPVFVAFNGFLLLGEAPTWAALAGILMVTAGAFGLNPGRGKGIVRPAIKALREERGSLYMLLIAFLWSFSAVLDKKSVLYAIEAGGQAGYAGYGLIVNMGITAVLMVLVLTRDRAGFRRGLGYPGLLLIVGLVHGVAGLLQYAAYGMLLVAYIIAIKRAGAFVAMATDTLWFGERTAMRRRYLAALIMMAGAAVVVIWG